MTASDAVAWGFFPVKFAAGLLLPGYLLGKFIRTPAPWLSAFLGSALVLFYLVMGLDALHVRIDLTSLALGLAVVTAGLLLGWIKFRPADPPAPAPSAPGGSRLWWMPPFVALAAVAARAVLDPLSGWDNVFRWDFLARQIWHTGSLAFYPPMTATDFQLYGWCDGIPPLVPFLNLWTYVSAGQLTAVATAPRVLLEAVLLFYAVGHLARRTWGATAGGPAMAVLATSSLLLSGVVIGQETGLTALTLVAMFVFLDEYRRDASRGSLVWAGVAAGLGALSREYALSWMLLGLGTLAWQRDQRKGWKIFLGTAVAIAAPWYLRNAWITGNPLYAQALGGLFPVNGVHRELMEIIGGLFGFQARATVVVTMLKFIAVTAGVAFGAGLWGFSRAPRQALPLFTGVILVGLLWIWSVSQTAGGWAYSTRVLTPAIALSAVLAGGAFTALKSPRAEKIALLSLLLLAIDAAPRMLLLFKHPRESPWQASPAQWLQETRQLAAVRTDRRIWRIIADEAHGRGIIVTSPILHSIFSELGAVPIALPSPQISAIFDETRPLTEKLAVLRAAQVRFLVFSKDSPETDQLVAHHAFLRQLRAGPPIFQDDLILLYDLDFIRP
jgi:hypothetical protein